MSEAQQNIQMMVEVLAGACKGFGFRDYMPDAKIGLYVRQSAPSSYEDGRFSLDQFYQWVRQEYPIPDHVFSRVFARAREEAESAGVKVLMPENFDPSFDEVIKEYLRYDHDGPVGGDASSDSDGPAFGGDDGDFQSEFVKDLHQRIDTEDEEELEVEVEVVIDVDTDLDDVEVATPWEEEEDLIEEASVESLTREDPEPAASDPDELKQEMKEQLEAEVKQELYETLGPEVHDEVHEQVELEIRTSLRSELLESMREEVRQQLIEEMTPRFREEVYPALREEMAEEVRVEEREELEQKLHAELDDSVREQLRIELWDEVRKEVTEELVSQLRPVVSAQLEGEFETHELMEVMGTGDDDEFSPEDLEVEAVQGIPLEPTEAIEVSRADFDDDDDHAQPTPATKPSLLAEDQLRVIKIIREKLGPAIRNQLISEFVDLASARELAEQRERQEKLQDDPDYCLDKIRSYLFPDQPALWEKIKPLIDTRAWRPVVVILDDEDPGLGRERLDRARDLIRESLTLKADIEQEVNVKPGATATIAGRKHTLDVNKMLAGANEALNFTLKSIAEVIEEQDPRPRKP